MKDAHATSDTQLRIERLVAAPPEQVYAYWTDQDLLMKWWAPEGSTVLESAFDFRAGGKWMTTMRRSDGSHRTVSGVYRILEPPRQLEFTWAWLNDAGMRGHETTVTITCETAPGGTRLVLFQREFESVDMCDAHGKGWNSKFNKLEADAR